MEGQKAERSEVESLGVYFGRPGAQAVPEVARKMRAAVAVAHSRARVTGSRSLEAEVCHMQARRRMGLGEGPDIAEAGVRRSTAGEEEVDSTVVAAGIAAGRNR